MLSDNTCLGFCMSPLQWGQPLTYTGKTSAYPEVTLYNGNRFCGVSNNTVVDINGMKHSSIPRSAVPVSSAINIVQSGTVRIRNTLIVNQKRIDFNRFVKPTRDGLWKVQSKKTKKSVGIIQVYTDHSIELKLL